MQKLIEFIIERDGFDGSITWAKRMVSVSRRTVLSNSLPAYRKNHIKNYLELKKFLAKHGEYINTINVK